MKRPIGITVLAGLMTFTGGVSTFILAIAIIDSLRFAGFDSILISSPASLAGFILYGLIPVAFYTTGISLFIGRSWTRPAFLFIISPLLFLLFLNMAYNQAKLQSEIYQPRLAELLAEQSGVFIQIVIAYLLIIVPSIFYLMQPNIIEYLSRNDRK